MINHKLVKSTLLACLIFTSNACATSENQPEDETAKKIESIQQYNTTVEAVKEFYVDDLNFSEIIKKSIKGLLSELDAHSSFMDTSTYSNLKIHTDGEFGGLGITVGIRDKILTIISPIEDTPADRAGLKAEDVILKIDDQATLDMTIDDAVSLMRGKPKTDIKLTVIRKGESKPLIFEITRDIIKLDSVYTKTIEDENILYVRVTNFDKKVKKEVQKALKKHKKVDGIILDLRNNPGGLLQQAVKLSDLFIEEGIIVSQKGKIKKHNLTFKATKKNTYKDIPLTVLVNAGSASASEIVAGALQDHKRAIIIGEKTFGKGSVQSIYPFSQTEAIKLTIARYYLPSDRTIQAVGITPDIIVHSGAVPQDENDFSIKENELKKHLNEELDKLDKEDKQKKQEKTQKEDVKDDKKKKKTISAKEVLEDIQLKYAIDILKVLKIQNGK